MSATTSGSTTASGSATANPRHAAAGWRRLPIPVLIAVMLSGLIGIVALLPAAPLPPARVLIQRDLVFELPTDGSVEARDARSGALVARVPPSDRSFVQGMIHGLQVMRRLRHVDPAAPLRIAALSDGRLTLSDSETGTVVDIEGFGPDNAASFHVFLGVRS